MISRFFTGPWAGEEQQFGVSFVSQDSGGVFPEAIKESLPQFTVNAIGEQDIAAEWTVTWGWEGTSRGTKVDQDNWVNAARTFFGSFKAYVPSSVRLEEVRISAFDVNGNVINGANKFYLTTPIVGTGNTTHYPPQVAYVMSTQTGARGPGGRGRMYLPISTGGFTNAVATTGVQDAVGNGGVAFLDSLQAHSAQPALVNRLARTYSSITQVRCGNQFDTHRSRREQVRETYKQYNV